MRVWPCVAAGLAVAVILWTGPAVRQSKPDCDAQGKMKAPEKVEGQVVKMEPADRIEAKLREAPKCP